MKKTYRIAPEVKTDILRRIKDEGVTVAQAAEQHGISTKTIDSAGASSIACCGRKNNCCSSSVS